jgi:hypothetical protein
MKVAIFPPQYFGSVGYYNAMSQFDLVVIDFDMRFDKRMKSVHRTTIADTRGALTLTMPISHPAGIQQPRWSDIRISAHGNWWDVQRGAIESAYGRTPMFEFLFDRFAPFFTEQMAGTKLVSHLAAIDATIREVAGITTRLSATLPPNIAAADVVDMRRADFAAYAGEPYTQIRAARLGFLPNLSILDRLFNR